MPDPLDYTDNGDGTVTINNPPIPESIAVGRVLWEQMVRGELTWATVENVPVEGDPNPVQELHISAVNVTAVFRRTGNGPGRTTYLDTISWV
jgi:hypothetical protein